MALGWQGTDRQWRHYRRAYGPLRRPRDPAGRVRAQRGVLGLRHGAGPRLALDLFAPFFVDGAIFSGFAMVLVLLIPMRYYFNLYAYITDRHLDNVAKLILVTGLVLTYFYACEASAWYSGEHLSGRHTCSSGSASTRRGGGSRSSATASRPRVLLEAGADAHPDALRRVDPRADRDVVRALQHHRARPGARLLPVHVRPYVPTLVDSGIVIGSFAWFFIQFLGFIKVMPSVSIVEVKETIPHPVRDGHAH